MSSTCCRRWQISRTDRSEQGEPQHLRLPLCIAGLLPAHGVRYAAHGEATAGERSSDACRPRLAHQRISGGTSEGSVPGDAGARRRSGVGALRTDRSLCGPLGHRHRDTGRHPCGRGRRRYRIVRRRGCRQSHRHRRPRRGSEVELLLPHLPGGSERIRRAQRRGRRGEWHGTRRRSPALLDSGRRNLRRPPANALMFSPRSFCGAATCAGLPERASDRLSFRS